MTTLRKLYNGWTLTHLEFVPERMPEHSRRCCTCLLFVYEGQAVTAIYLVGETPHRRLPRRSHMAYLCERCLDTTRRFGSADGLRRGLEHRFRLHAKIQHDEADKLHELTTFSWKVDAIDTVQQHLEDRP
jgi:hypothetical protein